MNEGINSMKKFPELNPQIQHDVRLNPILPKLRSVQMEMPNKIIPEPILKEKPITPPQLLQDLMRFQKEAFDKVVSGFGNNNNEGVKSNSESQNGIINESQNKESVSSVSTHNSQNEKSDSMNSDKEKQGIVNFLINIAKKSNGSNEPININQETLDPEEKKKICNTLDLLKAHKNQESTEKSKEERLNEKLRSLGILKSTDSSKSNGSQSQMKELVNKFFKSKDPRLQPKKEGNSNE